MYHIQQAWFFVLNYIVDILRWRYKYDSRRPDSNNSSRGRIIKKTIRIPNQDSKSQKRIIILSDHCRNRKRLQNWKMFTGFQFLPIFLPWSALADQPPNILLFLVDDLGHGDLGYPVTIHILPPTNQQQQQQVQHHRYLGHPTSSSPNIDRLAMDSVQFTQFYTARFEFWTKHCKNCKNSHC